MDDSLEKPSSLFPKTPLTDEAPEDDEQLSDEEDGGLDWTKLLPPSARPIIPRRGEKEFEPRSGGGTNLQLHVLDRSRLAMFDTLRATRTISSKAVSYAVWHPDISRSHVTVARGIHFSNMGHSAPRSVQGEDGTSKMQRRLELLPEEAIYLIERGSVFCWKKSDLEFGELPGLSDVSGTPMTVQQAFSEMIGKEDLTIEKFQVYAYLKRLGYVVTRTDPPDSYYPIPPNLSVSKTTPIMQRIKTLFASWMSTLVQAVAPAFNWWKPVSLSHWLHHDKKYLSLFQSMRFIPSGHSTLPTIQSNVTTPYRIFYNVYKPSTPFKKSAPPPPDFQLVVVNARTAPMPSLQELSDLFDILPEAPLPTPRQRRPPTCAANNAPATPPTRETPARIASSPLAEKSLVRRMFPWLFFATPPAPPMPARRPNPFMALKSGKKIVIVAAVDSSNTSFFRFSQGEFTEWPMV
ncbi:hypothetical protein HYPSUDRAFT_39134 [Hypholoma sublateritium FD-334 SS-4]|uniref:tRNA-splicing endonuclease subunit Sen54 N-terminal domain-containing protein n=1 Tax=Hypholoma sublateritium (strain FD-334 SS-4) TaxID=945553 RepID=A0A0D2P5L6_HYPSF|nr:hypothetical protein HYPSUDRAFT_39134 [Hypholoma sublateritium FD-334 SS-4]